jgi:hypothetical protein
MKVSFFLMAAYLVAFYTVSVKCHIISISDNFSSDHKDYCQISKQPNEVVKVVILHKRDKHTRNSLAD